MGDGVPHDRDLLRRRAVEDHARISRLTAEAAQQGAALMIFGEPGAGKSRLLNVAAGVFSAQKGRVLAAAGLEHEAEITFRR